MNELEQLKSRVAFLEKLLNAIVFSDHYALNRTLRLGNGINISVGGDIGTKIGTSPSAKIGFFGATPIVQQAQNRATLTLDVMATLIDNTGLIHFYT